MFAEVDKVHGVFLHPAPRPAMSVFDLSGRHAVVTGGQGRLGPIWVETLEEAGCYVRVLDLPYYDVSDIASVLAFKFELGKDNFYPDIIVNNAAIDNPPGTDASFWGNLERILSVNLVGAANMASAFIPDMKDRGGGVIINIGSIMGNIGADWRNYPPNFEKPVGYNLSKAGLVQLSRSITTQYGRYNIRSATIAFGPFDMGLTKEFLDKFLKNVPLGRPISEQSVRAALLFAVSCPELAGQQVLVDGGYTSF
jgi:NAD(P)-dependent dehydrogenase (short-subunit alcohol dehydrogenase family)